MQDALDDRDQAYREARQLREEQRQRLGIGREYNGPNNVVDFRAFRERRVQRPTDKPVKPAA
jgi:hypothetical protein